MTDVDVVIIGAGIAGLSAAKTIADAGYTFRILEASHRIGGRAYSEPYARGGMFDLGCSYLHESDTNPLKPIAAALGIELGNGDRFVREEWLLLATASHAPIPITLNIGILLMMWITACICWEMISPAIQISAT